MVLDPLDPLSMRARDCRPSEGLLRTRSAGTKNHGGERMFGIMGQAAQRASLLQWTAGLMVLGGVRTSLPSSY